MATPSPTIKPYRIHVPDAALERVAAKLALATLPGETTFSDDPAYGAPLSDIRRLVGVWRGDGEGGEKFDWRKAEEELNESLPQFETKISVEGHEELKVHFVHKRSEVVGDGDGEGGNKKKGKKLVIPLLFVHGWPGSFLEVSKILPLLTSATTDDDAPSFHVVAPSLPNFGFSQRTSKPGFGLAQHAEVCHKLMLQLGYDKYVTQGGDWGSMITRIIGILYPSHVLGSHFNFLMVAPPTLLTAPILYLRHVLGLHSPADKAGLARSQHFRVTGSGYSALQGTKPHTPGFAVADSPVGILAWVYEKLRGWTDGYPWTDREVLVWIAVYVFSDAGPDASFRLYYETLQSAPRDDLLRRSRTWSGSVPIGYSAFAGEALLPPVEWAGLLGPVVFQSRHDKGGHFAAWEKPELLVGDLRKMFGKNGIGPKLPF